MLVAQIYLGHINVSISQATAIVMGSLQRKDLSFLNVNIFFYTVRKCKGVFSEYFYWEILNFSRPFFNMCVSAEFLQILRHNSTCFASINSCSLEFKTGFYSTQQGCEMCIYSSILTYRFCEMRSDSLVCNQDQWLLLLVACHWSKVFLGCKPQDSLQGDGPVVNLWEMNVISQFSLG